ncbi:MAG: hypothetical protein Q4G08_03420 [Capnocytophaga sp.]|nr:hypothetical protein [Capnocytophaga sp.]
MKKLFLIITIFIGQYLFSQEEVVIGLEEVTVSENSDQCHKGFLKKFKALKLDLRPSKTKYSFISDKNTHQGVAHLKENLKVKCLEEDSPDFEKIEHNHNSMMQLAYTAWLTLQNKFQRKMICSGAGSNEWNFASYGTIKGIKLEAEDNFEFRVRLHDDGTLASAFMKNSDNSEKTSDYEVTIFFKKEGKKLFFKNIEGIIKSVENRNLEIRVDIEIVASE